MDLLEKLTSKTMLPKHGNPENKRVLGISIEKRPEIIGSRKTFGHWRIDTVVGCITKFDAGLLTLVELQTRFEVIFKLDGKDAKLVDSAIENLRKQSGDYFTKLFKTITSDNGSEFPGLHEALQDAADMYFSNPHASWERGTSENQHKLILRFIPKVVRLAV